MRASRGASIIVRPQRPELPSGACPTRMPVCCELIAVRCSDTLETRGGITECGVTALRAANAVKVFRAEEGRDKELIDWRFSGGFGYEIREKASLAKVTGTGFQLLDELISQDQSASLSSSTQSITFVNIWLICNFFCMASKIGMNHILRKTLY